MTSEELIVLSYSCCWICITGFAVLLAVVLQEWRSPDMWSCYREIYALLNNICGRRLKPAKCLVCGAICIIVRFSVCSRQGNTVLSSAFGSLLLAQLVSYGWVSYELKHYEFEPNSASHLNLGVYKTYKVPKV